MSTKERLIKVTVQRTKFMQMMNVGNNVGNNVGKDVTNHVTDVTSNVTSNVTSLSSVQLTDRQMEICKLIRENTFVSSRQMSQVLSVTLRTIRRDLAYMQKSGVLVREGNTSAGHWVLLKQIND